MATRYICAYKYVFTSYTYVGGGEELVYFGDF